MAIIFDIFCVEKDLSQSFLFVITAKSYLPGRGHLMSKYSEDAPDEGARPNDVRPLIDETDRRILEVLAVEAHIPNNALADRVGIARRHAWVGCGHLWRAA
jgi:hypothetical protein